MKFKVVVLFGLTMNFVCHLHAKKTEFLFKKQAVSGKMVQVNSIPPGTSCAEFYPIKTYAGNPYLFISTTSEKENISYECTFKEYNYTLFDLGDFSGECYRLFNIEVLNCLPEVFTDSEVKFYSYDLIKSRGNKKLRSRTTYAGVRSNKAYDEISSWEDVVDYMGVLHSAAASPSNLTFFDIKGVPYKGILTLNSYTDWTIVK